MARKSSSPFGLDKPDHAYRHSHLTSAHCRLAAEAIIWFQAPLCNSKGLSTVNLVGEFTEIGTSIDFLPMKRRSDQTTDVPKTNVEQDEFSDDVLKVCILFDSVASARCAKDFLVRVARSEPFCTTLVRAGELLASDEGRWSARTASKVDLMILAVETDQALPSATKTWLSRWINFRAEHQECALVGLVANKAISPDRNSPLIAYLETLAVVGKLAFFYGRATDGDESLRHPFNDSQKVDAALLNATHHETLQLHKQH